MRPTRSTMAALAVVVRLFFLATPANADGDPEIAVEASADEVFIGESIDYTVEVRNTKKPSAPDLSPLRQDFVVVSNGDESHNQSSTFIINGRVTQQSSFGHTYRYRLTPKRTGKLIIPALSATIEGKTISGRSVNLNVIAPEQQDSVVLEVKSDRQQVYPTQPFEITLRALVRPLPDEPDREPVYPLRRSPPHIDVNWVDLAAGLTGDDKTHWLEKLLSDDGSGFTLNEVATRSGSFFGGSRLAVFNLYHGRESRKGLDGQPVNYFVYELKRKLSADKAGSYTFGPAIVKGSFVDGREGSSYTGRRLVAVAPAVVVDVREVPQPRPATFCGGIGTYRLSASASPTSLRVGDPLTLTLDIGRGQGSGSLDLISAPDLAATPRFAADFEILDKNPTGRKERETKRFEYGLRPKRAGVGIPPVAVTVFDPETEKFSELTTEPIALTVTAGSHLGAGDLVGPAAGSAPQEIKSREQGIFQNISDPSELVDERVNVITLVETTVGVWLAVGCLIAGVSTHRRKSGDVIWRRRRNARRTAKQKLAEAQAAIAAGHSKDALRGTRSAIVGLIADMRNIVGEGMTATEARATLAVTSVPGPLRDEALRLLEAIESAEYGSGAASEAKAMLDSADGLISSLARYLERSA